MILKDECCPDKMNRAERVRQGINRQGFLVDPWTPRRGVLKEAVLGSRQTMKPERGLSGARQGSAFFIKEVGLGARVGLETAVPGQEGSGGPHLLQIPQKHVTPGVALSVGRV